MSSVKLMKRKFNLQLHELMAAKKDNNCFISKENYAKLIDTIKRLKTQSTGKTPRDYERLRRFDVAKVGDCEKLFLPITPTNPNITYYVSHDEIFDVIHKIHLSGGHRGRHKMIKDIKKTYRNITHEAVSLYLSLCEQCAKKLKGNKTKHNILEEIKSKRCQVDIIDVQSTPHEDYKFILVYQDCRTKFVQLHPLKTNDIKEIVDVLKDIFTTFGAPCVFQSENGREFSREIVEELRVSWKGLMIFHGELQHSDNETSEDTKLEIGNMITSWLESIEYQNWSKELRFVQLRKNKTYHKGLKCSPYEAMFGSYLRLGVHRSTIPKANLTNIRSEEEVLELEQLKASADLNDCDAKELEDSSDMEIKMENFSDSDVDLTEEPIQKPKEEILEKRRLSVETTNAQAKKRKKICEEDEIEDVTQNATSSNYLDLKSEELNGFSIKEEELT